MLLSISVKLDGIGLVLFLSNLIGHKASDDVTGVTYLIAFFSTFIDIEELFHENAKS